MSRRAVATSFMAVLHSRPSRGTARLAATAVLDLLHTEHAQQGVGADATMAEVSERGLAECAGQWKPATQISQGHGVRTHILPGLGKRPVPGKI